MELHSPVLALSAGNSLTQPLLLLLLGASSAQVIAFVVRRVKRRGRPFFYREGKYRRIFERAVEGIIQTSPDGHFLDANEAFATILGYKSPEELLSSVHDIGTQIYVNSADRVAFAEAVDREGVAKHEYEAWKKDGSTVWLSVSARAIKDSQGHLLYYESIAKDITERKRTENMLRESQERLQAALVASQTGTFRWKIATDSLQCDRPLMDLMGIQNAAHVSLRDFTQRIYEKDRAELIETLRNSVSECRDLDAQFRIVLNNGEQRWVSAKGRVVCDANNTPMYMTGACTNITPWRRAEDKLRLSEERYRSLVAATSSIVWTSDAQGAFSEPQPSWEAFTGQLWPDYKGLGWFAMIHPDDRQRIQDRWRSAMKAPFIYEAEGRLWNAKSHAYRHFEARAVALHGHGGQIREWVGTIVDIQDRKVAQEEERKFKFLSDNANDAYFLVNRNAEIAYVNRSASELLGYSRGELSQMSLTQVDDRFNRRKFEEYFNPAGSDRVRPFEAGFLRKDGTSVPTEVSLSRLEIGKKTYLFGIARDITERKMVEASLRRQAEELSRSNRELEQFAYISSHDLKEPLRMVTVYVQMLQNHLEGSLDEKAQEYLRYAVQGSGRMLNLINDLLAYSQVGREAGPFAEVNSANVLGIAVQHLGPAIEEANAQVLWEELPIVVGHSGQLGQLFENLIGNALKFRGTRKPTIRISAQDADDRWIFSVNDNGIGIHPRYLKRIFVIFQRLHTVQKYPGTGIGLSICKKIVENHGGSIWVESSVGNGSTFFFSIPKAQVIEQPVRSKPALVGVH